MNEVGSAVRDRERQLSTRPAAARKSTAEPEGDSQKTGTATNTAGGRASGLTDVPVQKHCSMLQESCESCAGDDPGRESPDSSRVAGSCVADGCAADSSAWWCPIGQCPQITGHKSTQTMRTGDRKAFGMSVSMLSAAPAGV